MARQRKQEAPFAVQLELSQGCNLGCDFCGIHQIGYQKMQRGTDLMSIETAESIASQMAKLKWNPRIEFAMHGEPTMHPAIDAVIGVFRKHLRKSFIMVTSNGGGLLAGGADGTRAKIDAMFSAGLNTLALDNYESVNIVPKIVERVAKDAGALGRYADAAGGHVPIYDYPQNKTLSPHTRHRGMAILVVEDISKAADGNHSHLNNHAGGAAPLDYSKQDQRCAKPFREMSIRWNGNVAICCNDWPGFYRAGNVVKDGLEVVWNSEAMHAARVALYNGRRDMIGPCSGCNAVSYRVGLLPDKLGRETLPKPGKDTAAAIAAAQSKGPYTKPVRKPIPAVVVP